MLLKQLLARLEWANLTQPKRLELARMIVAELNTKLGKVIELASTVSLHDIRLASQGGVEAYRVPKLAFRVPGGIGASFRSESVDEARSDDCDGEELDFVPFADASYPVQEQLLPHIAKLANLLADCS